MYLDDYKIIKIEEIKLNDPDTVSISFYDNYDFNKLYYQLTKESRNQIYEILGIKYRFSVDFYKCDTNAWKEYINNLNKIDYNYAVINDNGFYLVSLVTEDKSKEFINTINKLKEIINSNSYELSESHTTINNDCIFKSVITINSDRQIMVEYNISKSELTAHIIRNEKGIIIPYSLRPFFSAKSIDAFINTSFGYEHCILKIYESDYSYDLIELKNVSTTGVMECIKKSKYKVILNEYDKINVEKNAEYFKGIANYLNSHTETYHTLKSYPIYHKKVALVELLKFLNGIYNDGKISFVDMCSMIKSLLR